MIATNGLDIFEPDNLRKLRELANLSQVAAGSLIGTDQGHISRWERGHTRPDIRDLIRYIEALGGHVTITLDLSRYAPVLRSRKSHLAEYKRYTPTRHGAI